MRLPITLELRLSAALAEQVNVTDETNQPVTTATRTTLAGDAVRRAPIRISSRGLQDAIATTPGWATEDNGLMHARGVDDGFLYVVDGMPMYERMDSAHGIAPDPEMVESINVLVGHVPPEFGFKSGGVIEVRTSSRKSDSWLGNIQASTGSDATHQGSAVFGGPMRPVDGADVRVLRPELRAIPRSRCIRTICTTRQCRERHRRVRLARSRRRARSSVVGGFGRTSFEVPHNEDQEEGGPGSAPDQPADLADRVVAARMVRRTRCRRLPAYHRSGSAALLGSEHDTPLYHQRRPDAASRGRARQRHASSRQARAEGRRRGGAAEPARRLLVFRH